MTHDELLALIWYGFKRTDDELDDAITDGDDGKELQHKLWTYKALRAVVELHRPYGIDEYPKLKSYCTHCEHLQSEIWPCPTIQAIEKELG